MGRVVLVVRLALRDLRRRRTEAALLLIAVLAATTTLTLGLVLRDAAGDPYESTRAATKGPDVIAAAGGSAGLAELGRLAAASGVTGHSGPYPVVAGKLTASGRTSDVQVEGRDAAAAAVDQPVVTRGGWVGDGGVVVEAAFADWLAVGVGDRVTLGGRSFRVAGVAVTAAMPPYPGASCVVSSGCVNGAIPRDRKLPAGLLHNPGLVWLTRADALSLAPDRGSLSYVMNLRLADPAEAPAFADRNGGGRGGAVRLQSWQSVQADATELARDSQILLLIGAWLLGLLAVASLSVLAGGRMADQSRRAGLLKAVGGTPGLVAAVLLAEYLLPAVVAAGAGLAIGALSAPSLIESSAGLVGGAGTAPLTWPTVALVTGVALGVAVVATAVPAVRAARSSTVSALADAARPPRRTGWLIALSARLPVPLLLALRVAARRPRRVVLGVAGIAVTVSGIYVLMVLDAFLGDQPGAGAYTDAQVAVLRHVLLVWTVVLLSLAAVNAVVITWATVLDNRHASAVARALGATPRDVTVALAAAQVLPACLGAVIGVFPGGFLLFAAVNAIAGGDAGKVTLPAAWQLVALVPATALVVAALTFVPAHLGGRRPVTDAL
ncbi:FtsX-like permease family protein [Nonomuraea coxensis DSM 45129]|uniref:FtsX-like permease family protein n=1 Tax=Nonomuraea coxensis DSM 45129 TaxID=1122611 RepID=A0ABX8U613_9ACTN|nr:FtsX-like permease family protein [Nonomuraea coxensis]QYC42103.1 FtsX-like permease family protein [Nonomuraea coxensis DSM 45129]